MSKATVHMVGLSCIDEKCSKRPHLCFSRPVFDDAANAESYRTTQTLDNGKSFAVVPVTITFDDGRRPARWRKKR